MRTLIPSQSVTAPTWQTIVLPVTGPAGATSSTLSFSAGGTDDGYGPYLDAVSVKALSCASRADGSWQDPSTWACPVLGSSDLNAVPGAGNNVLITNKIAASAPASVNDLTISGGSLGIKPGGRSPGLTLNGNLTFDGTINSLIPGSQAMLQMQWQAAEAKQMAATGSSSELDGILLQMALTTDLRNQVLQFLGQIATSNSAIEGRIWGSPVIASTPTAAITELSNSFTDRSSSFADVSTSSEAAALTVSAGQPITFDGLTVGSGTALHLGPATSLTFTDYVANDGQITVPNGSSLLLGPSAVVSGMGTFSDGAAPEIGAVEAPQTSLLRAGVSVTAAVNDSPLDTLSGVWSWGDGTTSPATLDLTSGVGTAQGSHVYVRVGQYPVTLRITDSAGHESTSSITISARYVFTGFQAPVDNGIVNVAKAGRTIPLKWRLTDALGAPVTNLTGVRVTTTAMTCGSGSGSDAVEQYASGASGLQNLGDGYYQFNWATPKTYAGSCRVLGVDLGEGTSTTPNTHNALFQFTS